MTTPLLRPAATVTVGATSAPITDGSVVTLDEGWAPYGQGTVVVDVPPDQAQLIDPRTPTRVVLVASSDEGATPRTFNLGIRSRQIDYKARNCTLTVATDEAMVMDYAVLAEDTGAVAYQASLLAIVNYVLGKAIPGAVVNAGQSSPDVPVPLLIDSTNVVRNPRLGLNSTDWSTTWAGGPGAPGSRVAGGPSYAGDVWRMIGNSGTTTGAYLFIHEDGVPLTPGVKYRLGLDIRSVVPVQLDVQFFTSAGAAISISTPTAVPANSGSFVRRYLEFTAPDTTAKGRIRVVAGNLTTNQTVDATAARMSVRTDDYTDTGYFDGGTPDTPTYDYAFTGAAHASSSRRVPLVQMSPQLLTWLPGTSGWDFLASILTQVGRRLFCDEARVWRLVGSEFWAPGSVQVTVDNTAEAADVINREDPQLWAQGVAVRYTWNDATGSKVATDAAGSPGKVLVVNYARPYPGPGAAANILRSLTTRGRVQDVTALARFQATPGQELRLVLPGAALNVGRLRAVQFQLYQGLMRLSSKELGDMPPDAWGAVPDTLRWMDVADSVTWANYTP